MENTIERLLNKRDEAETKAINFYQKGEPVLARFWKNVSNCYMDKAMKVKVK